MTIVQWKKLLAGSISRTTSSILKPPEVCDAVWVAKGQKVLRRPAAPPLALVVIGPGVELTEILYPRE